MSLLDHITVLILTHERPLYLERILEYYREYSLKILVADSSLISGAEKINDPAVEYHHYSGKTHGQKLAASLQCIQSKYTVMCADDDFTLPDAMITCIEYLEKNKDFAVAQGYSINYKKQEKYSGNPELGAIYPNQKVHEIKMGPPLERVAALFAHYRTVFCAVHYTKHLQIAYGSINDKFSNLFLNEYLSGILPLIFGNYIELPIFFQVREYTEVSGDKTTDNLEIIYSNERYRKELNNYLDYITDIASNAISLDQPLIRKKLNDCLSEYARQLVIEKNSLNPVTFLKRLGRIIGYIPFLGKKMINFSRETSRKKQISAIVRTDQDNKNLKIIIQLILKYADRLAGK